jgi:hypothetical protein
MYHFNYLKEIIMTTNYEKQAKDFCEKYGVEFKAEFLANMPYFEDDKEKRDVYTITLKRGVKEYSFKFGQSISKSNIAEKKKAILAFSGCVFINPADKSQQIKARKLFCDLREIKNAKNNLVPPTEYDVFVSITKYDPYDFENFCAEYGYDTDSRKAEKIYFAVQKEYREIFKLFSDCMDELQEIN